MLNNSSSIVSAEHISNTISLVLNHQKNICVNFFISKCSTLFEYTNPSIAHSSNSTHTCIQLEESVNTLVDNTHSSNSRSNNTHSSNTLYNNTHSIDYSSNCISTSSSYPLYAQCIAQCVVVFPSVENEKRSEKAVCKSGEKIEIFVGRHLKFSPDRSCVIRQP